MAPPTPADVPLDVVETVAFVEGCFREGVRACFVLTGGVADSEWSFCFPSTIFSKFAERGLRFKLRRICQQRQQVRPVALFFLSSPSLVCSLISWPTVGTSIALGLILRAAVPLSSSHLRQRRESPDPLLKRLPSHPVYCVWLANATGVSTPDLLHENSLWRRCTGIYLARTLGYLHHSACTEVT